MMSGLKSTFTIPGMSKWEVETPALLLDMDAVEENIARMASWFEGKSCRLRPHAKTHKLPIIAHLQMKAGAIGITCAKLSEVQVFFEHGITDILLANEVVGKNKIQRLVHLSRLGNLIVCVDDLENARNISEAAGRAGICMNVLVEVNVGLNRCGVEPGAATVDFVRKINSLKHLSFLGLMGYEGGMYLPEKEKRVRCLKANESLVKTKDLLISEGFSVEIVSAGGSNTYYLTGEYPGITEVQVGSYVTMDMHNQKVGLDFRQALSVISTIVSIPKPGRGIIDAGLKAMSSDAGLPVCADPRVHIRALNEEHGYIDFEDPSSNLRLGSTIELIPSHGCTTIPLHDHYVLTRKNIVQAVTPIPARGALI